MAAKKSNTTFYILLGTLVIGGAAAAYFLYFKPKMDEKKKDESPGTDTPPADNPPLVEDKGSNSGLLDTPFTNEGQGNAFRAWVNKFYPAYAKSIDLDITGKTTTTAIKTAWTKYGNEYIKGNPNWEKYTGSLGSTGVPEKLKPFIERKVGELKQENGKYFILAKPKTPKGTPYEIKFGEMGGFSLQSNGKNWYYGGFSDGGRKINIQKDNYSKLYNTPSKDNKKFEGKTLFETFDKLFLTK